MAFYTDGSSAFVGVFDVVKIMILLMNSDIKGERFSIISENITFKEIIYLIADKMKVPKPAYELKPWMSGIIWRLDWFFSSVFKTKRVMSKFSAKTIHSSEIISNEKIKVALNYNFQSIDDVVINILSKR